jgi:hypothetical protein
MTWLKENPSENTLAMREWTKTDSGKKYAGKRKEYMKKWRSEKYLLFGKKPKLSNWISNTLYELQSR